MTLIAGSLFAQTTPPVVSNFTARYIGASIGSTSTTYCYFIQGVSVYGRTSISTPACVTFRGTLGSSGTVFVSWNPISAAAQYDVLRTTSTSTPTGACNCALAIGINNSSISDVGNSLLTYTVQSSGGGGGSGNATSIQSINVTSTAPTANQAPVYDNIQGAYVPTTVTVADETGDVVATGSVSGNGILSSDTAPTQVVFKQNSSPSTPSSGFTEVNTSVNDLLQTVDSSGNVKSSTVPLTGALFAWPGFVCFSNNLNQGIAATGGTVNYFGCGAQTPNATEAVRTTILPTACTARNLRVQTTGSQPASGSLVFAVRRNATTTTAITCTVALSGGAGVCSDTTNTQAFSAGDSIDIAVTNNASATSATITAWSVGCY